MRRRIALQATDQGAGITGVVDVPRPPTLFFIGRGLVNAQE